VSSGVLHSLAIVRTDVSENTSLPSSGFFRMICFRRRVTVESLSISLPIDEYYVGIMTSSGMLRPVILVRTDLSEDLSASVIKLIRIGELGTTLAVTSNRRTLRRNTKWYDGGAKFLETSVLTRATRRNIPEDAILHSHRRENFKSYILRRVR
jgi:hypothetical protein